MLDTGDQFLTEAGGQSCRLGADYAGMSPEGL